MPLALTSRLRRLLLPAVAALLSVAPACSATAGHKRDAAAGAADPSRRVAFRPLFAPARPKALYLSGYAGATYQPSGPGGLLYPSTYRQATGLGPCSTFRIPTHGH